MSFEASLITAAFILVTTLVVMVAIVSNRHRKAQEEEMRRGASSRGWKFESESKHGYRIHRWTGSTEGVAWTAESLQQASGGKNRTRRHVGRWHGAWMSGPAEPILFMGMPKGAEVPLFSVAEGDGVFAQMAKKAAGYAFDKAVDMYFGEEVGKQVDVTVMRRVNASIPGFVVMAADADEGGRFLQQGFEGALANASAEPGSVWSGNNRPWILMRRDTLSLARTERLTDITELDAFIRAGVALTRAPRFGRGAP